MPDSVSDPACRSTPPVESHSRESIPPGLAKKILYDGICHYCGCYWASVIDHVIPVAQGGRSVAGNLVPACQRCNAQKKDKTPARWRAWRLARGMSWPPPDCQMKIPELLMGAISEAEAEMVSAAVRAQYPPFMAAGKRINDRHHRNQDRPEDEDRAELLALAAEYIIEVLA